MKKERGEKGGEGREEEVFLVMWSKRLSALNPPLSFVSILIYTLNERGGTYK